MATTVTDNLYDPPAAPVNDANAPARHYGGIGRTLFVGLIVVVPVAAGFAAAAAGIAEQTLALAGVALTVAASALRLRNIGASLWWLAALLVPVVNVVVLFRCAVLPRGYADTRRMDTAGKAASIVVVVVIVVGLVVRLAATRGVGAG